MFKKKAKKEEQQEEKDVPKELPQLETQKEGQEPVPVESTFSAYQQINIDIGKGIYNEMRKVNENLEKLIKIAESE